MGRVGMHFWDEMSVRIHRSIPCDSRVQRSSKVKVLNSEDPGAGERGEHTSELFPQPLGPVTRTLRPSCRVTLNLRTRSTLLLLPAVLRVRALGALSGLWLCRALEGILYERFSSLKSTILSASASAGSTLGEALTSDSVTGVLLCDWERGANSWTWHSWHSLVLTGIAEKVEDFPA